MALTSRLSILATILLFFNCSPKTEQSAASIPMNSTTTIREPEETGVSGDFDGDGITEKVLTRVLNDANVNPDEPFSYSVEFSNPKLTPIEVSPMIGDGYVVLNEGDVDGKPGEELSIVVCDINNVAQLNIYAFSDKKWNVIAESINVDCSGPENVNWDDVLTKTDSGVYALDLQQLNEDSAAYQKKEVILSSASGDFDGNGESENVYIKTIHDASLDDSGYWEYSIVFSNSNLPPLKIENHEAGGCEIKNERDKDGKPGDELSVMQSGMMNKIVVEVYGFNGKEWKLVSTDVGSR